MNLKRLFLTTVMLMSTHAFAEESTEDIKARWAKEQEQQNHELASKAFTPKKFDYEKPESYPIFDADGNLIGYAEK